VIIALSIRAGFFAFIVARISFFFGRTARI